MKGSAMSNPYSRPSTVIPAAYRLRLSPDLEAATFEGTVEIDVEIAEPVTSIALNAIELEVAPATVRSGEHELVSARPVFEETYETATFTFAEPVPVGSATISLTFSGILNDKLRGFYLSTFEDVNGVTHRIATSQLEATDARRAFPCWDEPAFKATYQVTLDIPEELAAYSNTKEVSSTPSANGRRAIRFAETM